MSHERWPSDQEVDSISRMARESSDFFESLAKVLRPEDRHARADQSAAAPRRRPNPEVVWTVPAASVPSADR